MRNGRYIIAIILTFILEAGLCFFFLGKIGSVRQDTVAVNECVRSVETNFGNEQAYSRALDYVLIDNDGAVLFRTGEGLSESLNEAIKSNDTILDINIDGQVAGKVLIHNGTTELVNSYRNRIIALVLTVSFL